MRQLVPCGVTQPNLGAFAVINYPGCEVHELPACAHRPNVQLSRVNAGSNLNQCVAGFSLKAPEQTQAPRQRVRTRTALHRRPCLPLRRRALLKPTKHAHGVGREPGSNSHPRSSISRAVESTMSVKTRAVVGLWFFSCINADCSTASPGTKERRGRPAQHQRKALEEGHSVSPCRLAERRSAAPNSADLQRRNRNARRAERYHGQFEDAVRCLLQCLVRQPPPRFEVRRAP